jgi:hypothetical protein
MSSGIVATPTLLGLSFDAMAASERGVEEKEDDVAPEGKFQRQGRTMLQTY